MIISRSKLLSLVAGIPNVILIDEDDSNTIILKAPVSVPDDIVIVDKRDNLKTKSKRGRHNEKYGYTGKFNH